MYCINLNNKLNPSIARILFQAKIAKSVFMIKRLLNTKKKYDFGCGDKFFKLNRSFGNLEKKRAH